jgi:hypothetical protein
VRHQQNLKFADGHVCRTMVVSLFGFPECISTPTCGESVSEIFAIPIHQKQMELEKCTQFSVLLGLYSFR